jgi:hypothetical protein
VADDTRRVYEALRVTLLVATKERNQRPNLVPGPDGNTEPAWVGYERGVMQAEVNSHIVHLHRAVALRDRATKEAIMRVEREAEGHVDYVDKFAYGCAEIVTGHRDPQTGAPRG